MSDEKLYLVESDNGNGTRFILIEFNGINGCTQLFKTKKTEEMAQFLNEEYAAAVQENIIIFNELPCKNCKKRKKCYLYSIIDVIDVSIAEEIFNFVTDEQSDNVAEFMERND